MTAEVASGVWALGGRVGTAPPGEPGERVQEKGGCAEPAAPQEEGSWVPEGLHMPEDGRAGDGLLAWVWDCGQG